uniref:Reverse transcriptase RNase H-like domain-containing protein n=1 Tax=Xenopus tropicalis TaxID=8364 RepID=A0A803K2M9_XENTR
MRRQELEELTLATLRKWSRRRGIAPEGKKKAEIIALLLPLLHSEAETVTSDVAIAGAPEAVRGPPANPTRDRVGEVFKQRLELFREELTVAEKMELMKMVQHLQRVLERIRQAGLTLKPGKCHFGMAEVQYLGHRVGSGRVMPEPAKVEVIVNWPTPTTQKQVLAFLGTAGYYRRFIPNYSAIAKPLTDLTSKRRPRVVTWTPECATAMSALKSALVNAPVLSAPDFSRGFIVHTDASTYGIGAVLSQVDEKGGEHPIIYLSRKLLPREVAYATIEKECLAIVWALKKLQPYLFGSAFTVVTDHNPLSWLQRVSGDNGKLLRWSLALQQFNFTIQHRKGSHHGNADGLSRRDGEDCTGQGRPTVFPPSGGRPDGRPLGGERCE